MPEFEYRNLSIQWLAFALALFVRFRCLPVNAL